MKSQISSVFNECKKENRPALLTYTVAGDNSKKKSLEILKSISGYADILEIGFPHNAPTADGPQIQNSSYRALKKGIKLKGDLFDMINPNYNYKIKDNSAVMTFGAMEQLSGNVEKMFENQLPEGVRLKYEEHESEVSSWGGEFFDSEDHHMHILSYLISTPH